jgi:hypothetical protein
VGRIAHVLDVVQQNASDLHVRDIHIGEHGLMSRAKLTAIARPLLTSTHSIISVSTCTISRPGIEEDLAHRPGPAAKAHQRSREAMHATGPRWPPQTTPRRYLNRGPRPTYSPAKPGACPA